MKAWFPALLAVCGGAAFTWLDANNFFFVLPRLPFALPLVVLFVPLCGEGLRTARRAIPLVLTVLWMLALPWIPTSHTKRFYLAAAELERGMSVADVRARMEPFIELGVEYTPPPEMAEYYPGVGPEVLVFLPTPGSDQTCEVFFGPDGLTRVSAEYVD